MKLSDAWILGGVRRYPADPAQVPAGRHESSVFLKLKGYGACAQGG